MFIHPFVKNKWCIYYNNLATFNPKPLIIIAYYNDYL